MEQQSKWQMSIENELSVMEASATKAIRVTMPQNGRAAPPICLRILTATEWCEDKDDPQPMPLLVLSESSPFTSWTAPRTSDHPQDSGVASSGRLQQLRVVHIPLQQLVDDDRSFELPPRSEPFVILVEQALLHSAETFLIGGGGGVTSATIEPVQAGAKQARRVGRSWTVAGAILDTSDARIEIRSLLLDRRITVNASYHLWRPDSMIEHHLLPLLRDVLIHHDESSTSSNRRIEVWDLGSGVGRDVAFLARSLKDFRASLASEGVESRRPPDFRVVGIDQRYRPRDAERFRSFMHRQGVDDVTECRRVDLTCNANDSNVPILEKINEKKPICLYAVRYWNRPLFEALAHAADPGTIIAVTHFAKPAPDSDWPFPHPKEKHVLHRHELRDLFHNAWEILRDEIVTDNDHGRTLIQFVARRRVDGTLV